MNFQKGSILLYSQSIISVFITILLNYLFIHSSQILLDADDFNIINGSKFACSILFSHLNGFIFEHVNNIERQVEFDFKKLLMSKFFSLTNEVINFFNV